MVLYNDRVFCYELLATLEPMIRQAPNDAMITEFVEADIRNQLAFMELDHYQKHGRFMFQHPLNMSRQQHHDLEALRKSNPERFTTELINADKNITRYRSRIEGKKYKNETEKQNWLRLIDSYTEKKQIMQKLLAGS